MRPRHAWGILIVLWTSWVPAEPGYTNSRGERVVLTPLTDRVARVDHAVFQDPQTGTIFSLGRQLIVKHETDIVSV